MPSTPTEVEDLLTRAVELLIAPTLANLQSVETLLREAVVRMPEQPGEAVASQVRLCGRLIEGAHAGRPGTDSSVFYSRQGSRFLPSVARLVAEV